MSMRDRVAKAILAKVPQGYGMTEVEALEYADAVLAEMIEPTKAMLDAAATIDGMNADPEWRAMIETARDGH